jgi:16S rRNA (guanine1207-N2)-methyltransferase
MISPDLSNKTLNKIRKIFSISLNGKIYLPIVINPINLHNLLTIFPNKFAITIPNYMIYTKFSENQLITQAILNNRLEFNMDFFGIESKQSFENIERTILILPINLSLDLLDYALQQLSKILHNPCSILIISNNKKQNIRILDWLEKNQILFSRVKSQEKFLYKIPEFSPSHILQSEIEDIIFKIKYKKDPNEIKLFSSNGIFSKDKVDDGTDFLIDTVISEEIISKNAEIIDYFAGIGVIGIILSNFTPLKKIHFIESDLLSLFLLKRNVKQNQISNSLIHEVDGFLQPDISPKTIDFIVANPPTHIKKEDFISFLKISKKLLKPQGRLIIVINQIMPYEITLKEHFPKPTNMKLFRRGNYKIIIS